MRAYERLLNYVVVHTASDEFSETTPTTQRQFDLANMLVPEMKALGIEDARVSDLCWCVRHIGRPHRDAKMQLLLV